jgi:peptidoglycan hydrolase-like protein with peptidoglycan-binding domain
MYRKILATLITMSACTSIVSAQASSCPTITAYLTVGSRNSQVITLKKFLAAEKLLVGASNTNYFGPSTAAALKAWQKKKGLVSSGTPTTTGYGATGPKTRAALKNCRSTIAVLPVQPKPQTPKTTVPPVQTPKTLPPTGGGGSTPPASCTTETQTRSTNCPQGQTGSITETRTAQCPDKTWSAWMETARNCTTPPSGGTPEPKSCTFDGKNISHNATVTAYERASVPVGQTCTSHVRTCTDGTLSGTFTYSACEIYTPPVAMDIPDPVFPSLPSSGLNTTSYISNGDIYAAINLIENGAALTSINRGGFEYVINDPPATPQYRRGGSMQGSFFFDSPLTPGTSYHSYYNDCNNPLETGSVADFTTSFKGITSPTNIYSPRPGVFQSNAQLAYYVDPNGPTDWVDPTDYTKTGISATCIVGKINNPRFTVQNNAALSGVFLGKTVTLENIGTESTTKNVKGVIAIDMVLALDKAYTYAGLHPAFAAVPASLSSLAAYDPKTKTVATPSVPYGRNPVIAMSPDGAHAFGIYTPQVALEGEVAGGDSGYLRTQFTTGLHTMMPYIRYTQMPGGYYKFKSYYIVGSAAQVKQSIDELYAVFKVLDPKVFNWSYYVSQNGLGGMSEDQARLHWVTTGIKQGLSAHSTFSVKTYLDQNPTKKSVYGTNYHAAILDYLK